MDRDRGHRILCRTALEPCRNTGRAARRIVGRGASRWAEWHRCDRWCGRRSVGNAQCAIRARRGWQPAHFGKADQWPASRQMDEAPDGRGGQPHTDEWIHAAARRAERSRGPENGARSDQPARRPRFRQRCSLYGIRHAAGKVDAAQPEGRGGIRREPEPRGKVDRHEYRAADLDAHRSLRGDRVGAGERQGSRRRRGSHWRTRRPRRMGRAGD